MSVQVGHNARQRGLHPFGGFKASGQGRDRSLHVLENYTAVKTDLGGSVMSDYFNNDAGAAPRHLCTETFAAPAVVESAAERMREFGPGAVIALGGGSSLDAATGIALLAANPGSRADGSVKSGTCPGFPLTAVPTTSGTALRPTDSEFSKTARGAGRPTVDPRASCLELRCWTQN